MSEGVPVGGEAAVFLLEGTAEILRSTVPSRRRVHHIFNDNAIAGGGVVDRDMRNGANQLSILVDR